MQQIGRSSGAVPAASRAAANNMVIGSTAREHTGDQLAVCPKLALYASLVMNLDELQNDCPFAGTRMSPIKSPHQPA